jgi:hypothetical protein
MYNSQTYFTNDPPTNLLTVVYDPDFISATGESFNVEFRHNSEMFLKKVLVPNANDDPKLSEKENHRSISYQFWSDIEAIVSSFPFAAIEVEVRFGKFKIKNGSFSLSRHSEVTVLRHQNGVSQHVIQINGPSSTHQIALFCHDENIVGIADSFSEIEHLLGGYSMSTAPTTTRRLFLRFVQNEHRYPLVMFEMDKNFADVQGPFPLNLPRDDSIYSFSCSEDGCLLYCLYNDDEGRSLNLIIYNAPARVVVKNFQIPHVSSNPALSALLVGTSGGIIAAEVTRKVLGESISSIFVFDMARNSAIGFVSHDQWWFPGSICILEKANILVVSYKDRFPGSNNSIVCLYDLRTLKCIWSGLQFQRVDLKLFSCGSYVYGLDPESSDKLECMFISDGKSASPNSPVDNSIPELESKQVDHIAQAFFDSATIENLESWQILKSREYDISGIGLELDLYKASISQLRKIPHFKLSNEFPDAISL